MVVPLLLRTGVRHLCRRHRTHVLTALLVKAIMAVKTISEVTEVKALLLAVNYLGEFLKDAKSNFKSPLKSYKSKTKFKHENTTLGFKSYDSWNKAKAKLTEDEFNKRRRTNACINFGEVGHKFSNCLKPKLRILESVIDSTIPITRTFIPDLSSVINESCIIK